MLTDEQIDLLSGPNIGVLATLMPDGSPQATVLWVDHRDGLVWVNTATGRAKPRNLARDPRVSLVVVHRHDPYRAVQIRGLVVEVIREGADEHIDFLARKYTGEGFTYKPNEDRLIVKIRPDRASDL
jgi:PPOX class probable F420-dependent enzyme